MTINLVIDENIPNAEKIFSNFGNLTFLPGRDISPEDLKNQDAMIIRSVTKVNEELLNHSNIKFIGTCTIGTDHVDKEYLAAAGIHFTSAPGCNAISVAEYVISSLLFYSEKKEVYLEGKTLGIIGVGNVGSIVKKYAESIGMNVLLNDPPRERNGDSESFVSMKEILQADFITIHTPLILSGPDTTHHYFNQKSLKEMNPDAVLINTCRGEVINNHDLTLALEKKLIKDAILDVWENEPNISKDLFQKCFIGTPHIAGYSHDAKIRGGTMIAEQLAQFYGMQKDFQNKDFIQIPSEKLKLNAKGKYIKNLSDLVFQAYNPQKDHQNLHNMLFLSENKNENFDSLRKNYKIRREFNTFKNITVSPEVSKEDLDKISKLNFDLQN